MTDCAILILNWNGAEDTIRCLSTLLPVTSSEDYIFIIDNGSTDNSIRLIQDFLASQGHGPAVLEDGELTQNFKKSNKVYFVKNKENKGFGGGNNAVLKQLLSVNPDFHSAWLLNNDTIVEKASLIALKEKLNSDDRVAMAGSIILDYPDMNTIQSSGVKYFKWLGVSKLVNKGVKLQPSLIEHGIMFDYLNGASMLFRLSAIAEAGFFDERFFLYSEEYDLQLRLKEKGYTICFAPASRVFHKLSGGTSKSRYLFYYYYNASAILLSKKHFPAICTFTAVGGLALITIIRAFPDFKSVRWGFKGIFKGLNSV